MTQIKGERPQLPHHVHHRKYMGTWWGFTSPIHVQGGDELPHHVHHRKYLHSASESISVKKEFFIKPSSAVSLKKKKKRAGNAAQLFVVFLQHLKWYFALGPWAATVKQKYCLKGQFPEAISTSKLINLWGSEFVPLHVRIKYPIENREFYQQIRGAHSDPVFTAVNASGRLQRSGLGNLP